MVTVSLTPSERTVEKLWPTALERQAFGCDFVERETKTPVEVKTSILSRAQVKEMKSNLAKGGNPCLVILDNTDMLVFHLSQVTDISSEGLKIVEPQLMKLVITIPMALYQEFAQLTLKGSRAVVIKNLMQEWCSSGGDAYKDWGHFPYPLKPSKNMMILLRKHDLDAFDSSLHHIPRNTLVLYLLRDYVKQRRSEMGGGK